MMRDVMLDLETLGTRYNAQIISIGAVYFDRDTGEIGRGFSTNVDMGDMADRFTTDLSTIAWWFSQSDKARALVTENPAPLSEAIAYLQEFLAEPDIKLWSHATFDMPILMNAFNVVGAKFPVPFRNMRDLRTLMDLADHHSTLEREGTHHHALDDAKFQARYAAEAMQKLNARKQD